MLLKISIIIYVLNFAFAIFCLIDENDKSTETLKNQYKNITVTTQTEKSDEQKDLDSADDLLRSMLM